MSRHRLRQAARRDFAQALNMALNPTSRPHLLGELVWASEALRGLRRWRLLEAILANPNHSLYSLVPALDAAPKRNGALRPRMARALASNPLIAVWLLSDPTALGRLMSTAMLTLCRTRIFVERWGPALALAIGSESAGQGFLWLGNPQIDALWGHGHEPTRAALRSSTSRAVWDYVERLESGGMTLGTNIALTGDQPVPSDQIDALNRYLASVW